MFVVVFVLPSGETKETYGKTMIIFRDYFDSRGVFLDFSDFWSSHFGFPRFFFGGPGGYWKGPGGL